MYDRNGHDVWHDAFISMEIGCRKDGEFQRAQHGPGGTDNPQDIKKEKSQCFLRSLERQLATR